VFFFVVTAACPNIWFRKVVTRRRLTVCVNSWYADFLNHRVEQFCNLDLIVFRCHLFQVIMDSMNDAELDGKVDMHKKDNLSVESRIRRIAAGSGSHPNEVKMMILAHRQFEGMVSKIGKSGLMGKAGQARQQQMAAQMRKNPNLIQQRLNQMDPRMLQQMGGRENVMAMMQQMAKGGGAPGMGGGMPDMSAMMQAMGGGGAMPGGGIPQMPNGMDMEALMKMAQSMGGMPGMPPAGSR
jgi:Signal peptide binding domain